MDFSTRRRRLPLFLDLTPLIDVVFLLLIFFMVSTTFVNDSAGVKVELPRSSSAEVLPDGQDLTLKIASDGRIFVNGEGVDLDQLSAAFRKAAREGGSTLVVVRADKEVPHGRVIEVMDLARELGLQDFAIATEQRGAGGAARGDDQR